MNTQEVINSSRNLLYQGKHMQITDKLFTPRLGERERQGRGKRDEELGQPKKKILEVSPVIS